MSLTPSQDSKQPLAPRPKPKPKLTVPSSAADELESTIARFQAILTDSDREKLQDLKRAHHDIQSIITFTADLDRLDPKRRGKSVASRLASFLQTIEQFTSIIDTYIQSKPDLAALIWGSIKLTFLLLANITSYFLPFVDLLGGFVKSKAWSVITQSFQSEIRIYVEDIQSKAETVRDEIQLAKIKSDHLEQQRQAKEREAAAESRNQLSSWFSKSKAESSSLRLQEQKRESGSSKLCLPITTTAFNTARNKRHNGTAEWAFDTPEFRDWYESDQSAVLHITGKIGSGKAILVSRIIEHICQTKRRGQFVSFLLCRFDDHTSLKADAILRSLVQQILSTVTVDTIEPLLYAELIKTLEQAKGNFFPREGLQDIYEHASKVFYNWFIVVDGPDECHRDEQQTVYDFFSGVLTKCLAPRRIKLLLSSRETTLPAIDRSFSSVSRVFTGSCQTSEDIMVYAKDIITAKQSTNELVVGDKDLIDEIIRAIASKEQGMFLWAFLTIEDICCQKSDNAIREALDDIPADLPAVFNRVLGRIVQNRHQLIARDIFMWTLTVKEPLTLAQLREALSVKVGKQSLSKDDLINGIENIPIWCQSLVQVEKADNTVHFSHHSIQEYLLKADDECMQPFHLELSKSDDFVAKICLAYLNLSNFKDALVETRSQQQESSSKARIPLRGVPGQTIRTVVESTVGTKIGRLASLIVGPESPHPTDLLLAKLGTVPDASAQPEFTEHPFFTYATRNWYYHNLIFNIDDDSNKGGHDDLNFSKWKDDETLVNLHGILMEPHPAVTLPWTNQAWLDSLHNQFPHGQDECTTLDNLLQRLKNRHSQQIHLPFVAVYGHLSNNLAMAHLAFLSLITPVADEQTLQALFRVLLQVVKKPGYLSLCDKISRSILGSEACVQAVHAHVDAIFARRDGIC